MVGQERIVGLLDVRTHRYQGPWHGRHTDHRYRQPERLHRYHQERVPRIQDPDMRGTPDTQCVPLRGMEGQEGLHRRHEAYLQRPQPESGKSRLGGLCQAMGRKVLLCDKELEGQLGRAYRVLRVPSGDPKDYLYH